MKRFLLLIIPVLLMSCSVNKQKTISQTISLRDSLDFSFPVEFRYTNKIKVINHDNYKELLAYNPTEHQVIAKYILALKNAPIDEEIKNSGIFIEVPVENICCLSSTHVGAMETLGLEDKVVGGINVDKYWSKSINQRVTDGDLKEVGTGMIASNEAIIALRPNIVTTSDNSLMSKQQELAQIGITPVYNNDWRESSLLGRTEWLKVMALFFCENIKADSTFNQLEANYYEIRDYANQQAQSRPKVFVGQETRGTWYIPGEESYVASMIMDAAGSISTMPGEKTNYPCSFEKAYSEHHDAEYWLSLRANYIQTLQEFGANSEHYTRFKAFQLGNVFLNNKRVNTVGGNDFWESGVYRPDIVLKDLVKIIHPELYPEYEPVYWRKLH